MFMVSAEEAAIVRAAFLAGGEFDAMLELRRIAPRLSVDQAKECARTIAGWEPRAPPARVKVRRRSVRTPLPAVPSDRPERNASGDLLSTGRRAYRLHGQFPGDAAEPD